MKVRRLVDSDECELARFLDVSESDARSVLRQYRTEPYVMALGSFKDDRLCAVADAKRIRQLLPRPRFAPNGIEICYSTHSQERRQGHASMLVYSMIVKLPPDAPLYARVEHTNEASRAVLARWDFQEFWTETDFGFYVRHP